MRKLLSAVCCTSRAPYLVIANALVWAATILAVSLLTTPRDGGNSFVVLMLLIAAWFAMHSLIQQRCGQTSRQN
jgi:hypothetical protein